MSYCRFADNDAYIYLHVDGFLECCACRLMGMDDDDWYKNFTTKKISEMLDHIKQHRDAGHHIESYADERLLREQKEVGDDITPFFEDDD